MEEFDGKIRFVVFNYPYHYRDFSFGAAEALLAAGDQGKYWEMHDLLLSISPDLSKEQILAAAGSLGLDMETFRSDLETMIGQSGKMVSPELYIGVGLSGEQQHMVGITGAQVMVAVNNDSKSPVFEQVDLGIVDDCREFVPVFIKKIKEFQEKQVTC